MQVVTLARRIGKVQRMDKIVGSYCDFSWFCFITSDFFFKFWTCIITTTFIWTFTLTRQMQLAHRCHGFDFPQPFFEDLQLKLSQNESIMTPYHRYFRNVLNSPTSAWFNLSYGTQKRILSEWAQEIEKNISEGSRPGVRPLVLAVSTAALRSSLRRCQRVNWSQHTSGNTQYLLPWSSEQGSTVGFSQCGLIGALKEVGRVWKWVDTSVSGGRLASCSRIWVAGVLYSSSWSTLTVATQRSGLFPSLCLLNAKRPSESRLSGSSIGSVQEKKASLFPVFCCINCTFLLPFSNCAKYLDHSLSIITKPLIAPWGL